MPGEFLLFRRQVREELTGQPLLVNWWIQELCVHLTDFYNDWIAGRRPRLAIFSPPQHGKSWFVRDFIAFAAGKSPRFKTIFSSYSQMLGHDANAEIQRIMQLDCYKRMFGWMRVGTPGWKLTQDTIEYPGHRGSFYNTTIDGQITGKGFDLGVIDDPHKGFSEARSPVEREKVWNWFVGDFMSRQSQNAGLLMVMTRWHVDDLAGRYLDREQDMNNPLKVLRYSAIAEREELHRDVGEALFKEHKSLRFLLSQKALYSDALWQAIYQQHPIIVGGGQIPVEKLKTVEYWNHQHIRASIRYWDKAGTEGGGAYTAGVLMHWMDDGRYVISHIKRGQWEALERERNIKATSEEDKRYYKNYIVWVEQEPGSGGKESAENTIRNLAGFRVFADRVTGSKEERAQPFVAQVQGGNVWLVAGTWVWPFLDECEGWPNSTTKDQVDAAAGAFAKLVAGSTYDTSYRAFQPGYRDQ